MIFFVWFSIIDWIIDTVNDYDKLSPFIPPSYKCPYEPVYIFENFFIQYCQSFDRDVFEGNSGQIQTNPRWLFRVGKLAYKVCSILFYLDKGKIQIADGIDRCSWHSKTCLKISRGVCDADPKEQFNILLHCTPSERNQ